MRIQYVVLLLALVGAAGALEVSVSPTVLYESTSSVLTLNINNRGGHTIREVKLTSQLPVIKIEPYEGWASTKENESIVWSQGSIESNVQSAVFEFEVQAPASDADRVLPGTILVDGVTVGNYSVHVFADQTENVIKAAVKKSSEGTSSTDRVKVPQNKQQYVPVVQLDRPSPVPEENNEYMVLPPLEPRAAMELPTGFVSGNVEKIKAMKWMFLVFAIIVIGIYVYDQRADKWLELNQLRKKNKNQ